MATNSSNNGKSSVDLISLCTEHSQAFIDCEKGEVERVTPRRYIWFTALSSRWHCVGSSILKKVGHVIGKQSDNDAQIDTVTRQCEELRYLKTLSKCILT